jgi:23S rRNA (cytosine1962-C5)-methyltransferase
MPHRLADTGNLVKPRLFAPPLFPDYELVDSGAGEKLERFGDVVLRRPDPQALWARRADEREWARADLRFERDEESGGKRGRWIEGGRARAELCGPEPEWRIRFGAAVCIVRPTPFKHVGLFPEQAANWQYLIDARARLGAERPRLLNLFGYTGVASVVAAQAGYEVTHVDASKTSLAWLKENAQASGLADNAVRVLLDDALAFARREVRRGSRYHAILVDPPHFGRGPKGETWQFEDHMAPLVEALAGLTAERAFLVLSTYAIGFSPLSFHNLLAALGPGELASGELALAERERAGLVQRFLPCGFCARWSRGFEPPPSSEIEAP